MVAILHVRPEEASLKRGPGFYRMDADVMEIDEALQMVAASLLIVHRPNETLAQD
jgi:hypothetical protein